VQQPRWPVFLGRRSCVPALPIYEGAGDYPDLLSALQAYPYRGKIEAAREGLRVVIEVDAGKGVQRRDEMLSNRRRTFLPRYTLEQRVFPTTGKEDDALSHLF